MTKLYPLLLSLLFSLTSLAQTKAVISATDKNDDTHYYYYNSQNQIIWELVGTTRYEYEYNAAGQRTKRQTRLWVANPGEYRDSDYELYEYDAEGNISKTTVMHKPYGKDAYEEDDVFLNYTYEFGYPVSWDNYYKGDLYYNFRNTLTRDESGDVTKVVTERFDPDAPEKGWTVTATLSRTYTMVSPDYVPANLQLTNNNGNITLTWSPVAGAEKYIVTYDNTRAVVTEGTSFSVTLETGERQMAVQAVIDGVERNAAFCSTSVHDPGMLAPTDLTVGNITEVVEETESEELTTRTFYLIPLSWTLPAGHSDVVKYNIYYSSKTYGSNTCVSQVDPLRSDYILKIDPFEVVNWDEDGNFTSGIDTPIYVTVVYTTGESEKSNTVIVNPYKSLGHETNAIHTATLAPQTSTSLYNVSGAKVTSANGIIIKNGKKYFVK